MYYFSLKLEIAVNRFFFSFYLYISEIIDCLLLLLLLFLIIRVRERALFVYLHICVIVFIIVLLVEQQNRKKEKPSLPYLHGEVHFFTSNNNNIVCAINKEALKTSYEMMQFNFRLGVHG
jgi:hypothetical protein